MTTTGIGPDDRFTDELTVADLEDRIEGEPFLPGTESDDHFICDFCSTGVKYSSDPRIGIYVADGILTPELPMWRGRVDRGEEIAALATYCEDCATKRLLFPCRGYAEARLFASISPDRRAVDVEATDVSPADDGIPWDPAELHESITTIPFRKYLDVTIMGGGPTMWGPENIVTFFLSFEDGVDIRDLVKYDGSIDRELLQDARDDFGDLLTEMRRAGEDSRRAFRDRVRDK